MLLSVNWLKDYVKVDVPVKEFADRMILSGSNIETVTEIGTGMSGVKLGKIEKIEKHPDADRLSVCQVNIGSEVLQIVTSADNIYEGAYVPVATHNSRILGPLHGQPKVEGGVKIKKGKMRGVASDGMLCGPQELGFGDKIAPYVSKDGIWLLPGNWDDKIGEDFDKALELEDHVIDFEITPNRPDCLCMLGMAREAAATFGETMTYPDITVKGSNEDAKDYVSVEVKSDLCKRYTARVIKDVKIEQSPWWMQKRLMAAGMRPINNIVDITNFVMLEYGQPLHAFDINTLAEHKIIVDTAKGGEKFTTLDGTERTLEEGMLMINDANGPIAVAGVMGGLDSDITENTNTVVLESAGFVGSSVRITAKKLGMRTEASSRIEKGLDPNNCEAAADRFCKLVEMLGCGTVLNGSVDVYKNPEVAPTVKARVSRINKVLGTDISREKMTKYLESLEMKVEGEGDDMLVTPPTVRIDLLEEVDYVEEVARMYGYDNLPMTLPKVGSVPEFSKSWTMRSFARDLLSGMGASEVITYSFSNNKIMDAAGIPETEEYRNLVKIINPMGDDTEYLRTILIPDMLTVMGTNCSRNIDEFRAYEFGLTYQKNHDGSNMPKEARNLVIGAYGPEEDFFTLKGMITSLLDRMGLGKLTFRKETEFATFHPGRCANIFATDADGKEIKIGVMGEVHPNVSENFGINGKGYVAELLYDEIIELTDREIHYEKPAVYPATSRDVAIIVDEEVEVGTIEEAIRALDEELLEDVKLFDIYRGKPVPEGKKSVAYSVTYRSNSKTLTDDEADTAHANLVAMLEEKFDASLRD